MQIEDPQTSKPISNNSKIRISNTRIERTRNRLSKVQFNQACEPIRHFTKHVRSGTCGKLLPFGTL